MCYRPPDSYALELWLFPLKTHGKKKLKFPIDSFSLINPPKGKHNSITHTSGNPHSGRKNAQKSS